MHYDRNHAYGKSILTSDRRGYATGLGGEPTPSEPMWLSDVLSSRLWSFLATGAIYEFQTTMSQPVGGMDTVAQAFAREAGDVIRYNAKVVAVRQDEAGVTAAFEDAVAPKQTRQARADWCICTLPLSVRTHVQINVDPAMAAAIDSVLYASSFKVGLQFKRRFWKQDEAIYGGISYTNLSIRQISYLSMGYGSPGKGVLLGGYNFGPYAYEFTALPPAERVRRAVEWSAQLHPQYREEFETGIAVGWRRVPSAMGCYGVWSDAVRAERYASLCGIDGRMVLAGEYASYIPAWQEGAILSALDTIKRLHRRVMAR